MTLIEFFDSNAVENICACMAYKPERVILVGHDKKALAPYAACYEQVLADRELDYRVTIEPVSVSRSNLRLAVEALTRIVEKYDDCVFGLTGGEDLYLTAVGIVKGENPDKNIQLHRFNIADGVLTAYDQLCDVEKRLPAPDLTVRENVRIYGGSIIEGDVEGFATYEWDVTDEFAADAETAWRICKDRPWEWNSQMTTFAKLIEEGSRLDDGLTVEADIEDLIRTLSREKLTYQYNTRIINQLLAAGLLTDCREQDGKLIVSFKDLQVKRCLGKAGTALELRVYIAALDLAENGEYVYNDVINGAFIDWDGRQHDEKTQHIFDTENEIDIFLMHGLVPVFISCKNGRVTMDELYKLESVARHFGGKYARMALIATSIPRDESSNYLRQRAIDMDIRLIEDVKDMPDEELLEQLKKCWRPLTKEEKAKPLPV